MVATGAIATMTEPCPIHEFEPQTADYPVGDSRDPYGDRVKQGESEKLPVPTRSSQPKG